MPDQYGLVATERVMASHVQNLMLDLPAASAVSNLYRAANAVRNHLTNTVLREHDLSWTGWVVLWVVWIWDGLETRHAAECAAISKGTLTGVAKTLEARGWLLREPDEADRRLMHLRLTPAGLALMEQLYPAFNEAEAQVVSDISERGLATMTKGLRMMVTTLEDRADNRGGSATKR